MIFSNFPPLFDFERCGFKNKIYRNHISIASMVAHDKDSYRSKHPFLIIMSLTVATMGLHTSRFCERLPDNAVRTRTFRYCQTASSTKKLSTNI